MMASKSLHQHLGEYVLYTFSKHHGLSQIQENTYTIIADKIFWTLKIAKNFRYLLKNGGYFGGG